MFMTSLFTVRKFVNQPLSRPALAAGIVLTAIGLSTTTAFASLFIPCTMMEQACEVHTTQMQSFISQTNTKGPYDFAFTIPNCQSALASAQQTGLWPKLMDGEPAFPCSP